MYKTQNTYLMLVLKYGSYFNFIIAPRCVSAGRELI